MKRYAMQQLVDWMKKPNRKPLVLKGARQVGKTWLMKEFGRQYFSKVAYVSFFNNQRMQRVFDDDYDIERIIMNINIETHVEVTPEDTLIILDEIQEAPRALESLKYFCENAPEYAVIAAGSLLGVAIHKGVSYPVGKVDSFDLYPMNYREFLDAMGEESLSAALIAKDYRTISNFKDKYTFWLKNYYFVGGMPEIVQYFSEHKDYNTVREMQSLILSQYEDDFGKHTETRDLARIRMVWNAIPMQLAKENKKFFFGQVKKGSRSKDYEIAIQWLIDCGLILKVNRVTKPYMPLKSYVDPGVFKLFILDVGLLGAMSELDADTILNGNSIFTEFKGAFAEQYVLQEIVSETKYTPYYYGTESATFEMDFMIQKSKNIIPIEVKAETNLQAKSLKVYCQKYQPKYAIRISMMDYKEEEWLINLPLYAVANL